MLEEIKANIERLIAAYESVKVENAALRTEVSQYKEQIEDHRKHISELEKQIDNLKLTGAFLGRDGNRAEARAKIEKMIKEIDRCISLIEV